MINSKHTDFCYAHTLRQEPCDLILVRTGNIGVRELKDLFARNLSGIVQAFNDHSLIALDRLAMRVVI